MTWENRNPLLGGSAYCREYFYNRKCAKKLASDYKFSLTFISANFQKIEKVNVREISHMLHSRN